MECVLVPLSHLSHYNSSLSPSSSVLRRRNWIWYVGAAGCHWEGGVPWVPLVCPGVSSCWMWQALGQGQ